VCVGGGGGGLGRGGAYCCCIEGRPYPSRPSLSSFHPPALRQVLVSELGEDWETKVAEFDWQPMAAASIGQVRTTEGRPIALQAGGSQLVVC
jgi:hypothetical protein